MKTLSDRIIKFSGPPGTGKSTTLLNVVHELLGRKTPPEDIVFTTFSRAGAYEARDRASARFKLPEKSLPYFATLHSLCLSHLPVRQVMEIGDWCAIANTIGVRFGMRFQGPNRGSLHVEQDGLFAAGTRGDALLALWSLARTSLRPLKAILEEVSPSSQFVDITEQELQHFADSVVAYKREHGKIDYTDMLETYLTEGRPIGAQHVIIDEAQDLSNLQWKVLEKICAPAKHIWVAGDDDQCIHAWNGASVESFIDMPAREAYVLPQSYRVPASVHAMAIGIINRVKHRIPKTYNPTTAPGQVLHVSDLDQVDMSEGSWLLLARNQVFLRRYAEACHRKGLLYTGLKAYSETSIRAIAAWKALCAGESVAVEDAKTIYSLMSSRDRVRWGFKGKVAALESGAVNYNELVANFGLLAPRDQTWQEALDGMPLDERAYLSVVEKTGGFEKCRITISTIHGAKGKEADNVVLCPDMTQRTFDGYFARPEPEHRVWYVGVTRARKNLFILNPASDLCYPL